MGYNLTNERIQDTFEQLVQISGSKLVDGTGSLLTPDIDIVSSSYATTSSYSDFAVTASYAQNVPTVDTSSLVQNTTFNAYTGSNDAKVDSLTAATSSYLTSLPSGTISSSAQVDYDSISNVPSGIVSGAAQLPQIAQNTSDISTQTSRVDSLVSATSSYAVKSADNIFSGTQTFESIAVNGTASIAYLQQVTGSAKVIGDAYIILNADTPSQRYGGLKVYDSGSSPVSTGSFIWDSENNDWFYEYQKDATDYAVALFGPEFSTKGTPTYLTTNTIPKAAGGHHLGDSNISDDGSQVSITGDVSASTYYGDGSNLSGIEGGLVNGSGTDSLKSNTSLTTTPATASGAYSIALGEQSEAQGDYSIAIGFNSEVFDNIRTNSIAIGKNARVAQYSQAIGGGATAVGSNALAVGESAVSNGGFSTALGNGAAANGLYSIAIGDSVSVSSTNEINIGGMFKYDGSSTIDLTGASLTKVGSNLVGGGAPSVSGDRRFVFANGSSTSANDSVILGGESNNISTSYVGMFGASGTTISSGDLSVVVGGYQHTINGGARNATIGGESVTNNQDYAIVLGRKSFTTPAGYTTYVAGLDVSGSAVVSGSVEVTGQIYSPTFAGSVASSTSSIDFDNGNFATLSLTAATYLANPSNLKSGTTYTIIISSGSLIANHGTAWKFAGGTAPTYTNGTDVLTCVSDGTNLYATALTDFQ